jgi:hypothetical protein
MAISNRVCITGTGFLPIFFSAAILPLLDTGNKGLYILETSRPALRPSLFYDNIFSAAFWVRLKDEIRAAKGL